MRTVYGNSLEAERGARQVHSGGKRARLRRKGNARLEAAPPPAREAFLPWWRQHRQHGLLSERAVANHASIDCSEAANFVGAVRWEIVMQERSFRNIGVVQLAVLADRERTIERRASELGVGRLA